MKCFVVAIMEEAESVISNMTDVKESFLCEKKVYEGTLCNEQVCLILCGVGKVNAACGAQIAIDLKGANCIINIGTAGALSGCQTGGIYCVSEVVQYDFDLVQLNNTPIGTLNEFDDRWLKLKVTDGYSAKKVATGDRFNDSTADFTLLTEELCADIRDMECGAIAQVCAHAHVPLYAFKAISDTAGSGSTTDQFNSNLELCKINLTREMPIIFDSIRRSLEKEQHYG